MEPWADLVLTIPLLRRSPDNGLCGLGFGGQNFCRVNM